MSNMASIISSSNRAKLNPDVSLEYGCICRSKNKYPLQNNFENNINDEGVLGFLKHLLRSVS